MANWNYNSKDYEERSSFSPIPVGDRRVRIADAVERKSNSGNDMIEITLDVSGHNTMLWYYMVFLQDNPQMTNQKLGQIFESFGIKQGDLNVNNWIGKTGAARIKHEMYEGEPKAKISYFLTRKKQESLPVWVETKNTTVTDSDFEEIGGDDDLPFTM